MGVTVSDYREERWAPSVPLVPSAAASPGAEPDGSLRDEEGKQPMGTTEDGGATPEAEPSGDQPVGTLRGAGVQVDIAKVGRVVLALVVVALVVVGGMLLGLDTSIDPLTGFRAILAVFAAAVLGGLGSIPGAVLGALAIGVAEELSQLALPSDYRSVVGFLAILLVLSFRPSGILGVRR